MVPVCCTTISGSSIDGTSTGGFSSICSCSSRGTSVCAAWIMTERMSEHWGCRLWCCCCDTRGSHWLRAGGSSQRTHSLFCVCVCSCSLMFVSHWCATYFFHIIIWIYYNYSNINALMLTVKYVKTLSALSIVYYRSHFEYGGLYHTKQLTPEG